MIRLALAFFLGILIGAWEIATRPFLPSLAMIQPLLAVVILMLIGSGRSRALAMALGGALLMDLYTFGVFDFSILRWFLLVYALDLLLQHVLTNRSLFAALALTFAARSFEQGSAWIMTHSTSENLWVLFLFDGILVTFGFLVLAFLTKRLSASLYRSSRAPDLRYERS
ncbi:hypothetical protein EXS71_04895 [Candidatus Uhrbacteria bacterium]|nr:hypothetical protein [Candidatus Uhrbacteria bacterium]